MLIYETEMVRYESPLTARFDRQRNASCRANRSIVLWVNRTSVRLLRLRSSTSALSTDR